MRRPSGRWTVQYILRATFMRGPRFGWVAIWIGDRSLAYSGAILHIGGLSLFFTLETVAFLPPFALPTTGESYTRYLLSLYGDIHRTPDKLQK